MASFARIAPVALAGLLVAGGASAQPGGPRMPPGHPMAQGASFGPDCAVSAIEVVAQPRRTMAVVDVGLRFRSNKGGNCMARAEAVQITTGKAGAVSRAFSELVQDDQVQKPIAVADAPGGERLRPWMTQMKPGEEKTIVYRFYVDGDVLVGNEVDPASRVRVDLRALGTRVLEHTPIKVSLVLPQAARGKLSLQTGNPKGTTQNVGTTAGKAEIKQSLTKDDLLPVIDFKVESELPAAVTPATLTPGLGTLEYMRDGFARELATALDGNKDEKKVAEAWDRAYDLAFMALRSTDPIVAGHGVRTMAWLASGLSPAATHVRAEGESGDGVVVPASIAKEAAAAMTVYGNLTGQRTAPSPVGARSVRLVLPRLGEPGSRKKEAEEGLKRLAKRVEKKEVTETKFADTFAALAFPKVGAGAPATSRAIVFGPKGPQFVGEGKGGHAAPKRAFAGRMTRYLTHGRGVLKVFFGITALGGLGVLIYLAMSRVKGSAQEGASAV